MCSRVRTTAQPTSDIDTGEASTRRTSSVDKRVEKAECVEELGLRRFSYSSGVTAAQPLAELEGDRRPIRGGRVPGEKRLAARESVGTS